MSQPRVPLTPKTPISASLVREIEEIEKDAADENSLLDKKFDALLNAFVSLEHKIATDPNSGAQALSDGLRGRF